MNRIIRIVSVITTGAAVAAAAESVPEVILHQGFEETEEFSAFSPNGYTTIPVGRTGRWGVFGRDGVVINELDAAVGERSAKIIRLEKGQYPLIGVSRTPAAEAMEAEVWFLREPQAAFTLRIGGFKEQKFAPAIAIFCTGNGEIQVYDEASKRYLPSGVVTPAEEWTQLKFRFVNGKCRLIAGISGEEKDAGEFSVPSPAELPLDRIECVAAPSPVGSGTSFDEITFTLLPENPEVRK